MEVGGGMRRQWTPGIEGRDLVETRLCVNCMVAV